MPHTRTSTPCSSSSARSAASMSPARWPPRSGRWPAHRYDVFAGEQRDGRPRRQLMHRADHPAASRASRRTTGSPACSSAACLHQPLVGEPGQRIAHRRPRQSEPLGELCVPHRLRERCPRARWRRGSLRTPCRATTSVARAVGFHTDMLDISFGTSKTRVGSPASSIESTLTCRALTMACQRPTVRKNWRMSLTRRSGTLCAAKCPPWSYVVQRTMFWWSRSANRRIP